MTLKQTLSAFAVTLMLAACHAQNGPYEAESFYGTATDPAPAEAAPAEAAAAEVYGDYANYGQRAASTARRRPELGGKLGTEYGERISSRINHVDLVRYTPYQPLSTLDVHYSARGCYDYLARPCRQTGEALLANGRIRLSVLDNRNRKWNFVQGGSKLYLRGIEGERYQLHYENRSRELFEIVTTVDGIDVINGRPGAFANRGYVLYPGSSVTIEGFRSSSNDVAAFRFSAPRDAYAANTDAGSIRNVGIIGTAVFTLYDPNASPYYDTPSSFPAEPGYAPPPDYRR